jgi:hypothetical protein
MLLQFKPHEGPQDVRGLAVINQAFKSRFRGSETALAALLAMLWANTACASLLGITTADGSPPDIKITSLCFDYFADTDSFIATGKGWSVDMDGVAGAELSYVASSRVTMLTANIDQNGVFQSGSFSIRDGNNAEILGGTLRQFGYQNSATGPGVTLQFVADELRGSLASEYGQFAGINIGIGSLTIPPSSWVSGFGYHSFSANTDIFPVIPEPTSFLAWSLGIGSLCLYRCWSRRRIAS